MIANCWVFDKNLVMEWYEAAAKETRPGVSSCPPGCKIYPQNSKVSIDQNFASYNNKAVVETIKL